jgi:hypothetical protein
MTRETLFSEVEIPSVPSISSLSIWNDEILSNIMLHSPADVMCCPSLQARRGYRLYCSTLFGTRWATWAEGG